MSSCFSRPDGVPDRSGPNHPTLAVAKRGKPRPVLDDRIVPATSIWYAIQKHVVRSTVGSATNWFAVLFRPLYLVVVDDLTVCGGVFSCGQRNEKRDISTKPMKEPRVGWRMRRTRDKVPIRSPWSPVVNGPMRRTIGSMVLFLLFWQGVNVLQRPSRWWLSCHEIGPFRIEQVGMPLPATTATKRGLGAVRTNSVCFSPL